MYFVINIISCDIRMNICNIAWLLYILRKEVLKLVDRKIIYFEDKEYPLELKGLKQPPQQLYVIGNTELLKGENTKIAIVGTRKNTEYGKYMALNFSKKLSANGIIVISGLAKGIDSYSHIGAMVEKSKTIAVLPCGLENIYPKENQNLYKIIVENGGLVITEYADRVEADSYKFTERNRIVATLSKGVLVVEGDYRSGTRNTAKIAAELNLPIFCIPSNLDSKKGYVPNLLIKKGGYMVTSENDIIDKIKNRVKQRREVKMRFEDDIEEQFYNKFREMDVEKKNVIEQKVDGVEYKVYSFINDKPIDIDELVKCTNMDVQEINYEITMLTLEERVVELPGRKYILKGKG